jgi:hypothetical protein
MFWVVVVVVVLQQKIVEVLIVILLTVVVIMVQTLNRTPKGVSVPMVLILVIITEHLLSTVSNSPSVKITFKGDKVPP